MTVLLQQRKNRINDLLRGREIGFSSQKAKMIVSKLKNTVTDYPVLVKRLVRISKDKDRGLLCGSSFILCEII